MAVETKTRAANSYEKLEKVLTQIESGKKSKPDWIRLKGSCRLDRIELEERQAILRRIHKCALRGFSTKNIKIRDPEERLVYWQSVAREGFHNFSDLGWMKCYDSPFVENYDYVKAYQDKGLDGLDPYAVYSAVLGTFDFSAEDFITTELCANVKTLVEPMAGTADFSHQSHFFYPDFRYVMIDLDDEARQKVLARDWLAETEKHYIVDDVLGEPVWEQVKSLTTGESLAYIGKQSHHVFDAKQLFKLLDTATRNVDYLMLETLDLSPVTEMGGTEDMTRQEMEDAGFEAELREDPDGEPNPFTNMMHFHLVASDDTGKRDIFPYRNWTIWSHPILVAFARLLDLQAYYFHSELEEFVSVEEEWDNCDVEENVTFMLFTRRSAPQQTGAPETS